MSDIASNWLLWTDLETTGSEREKDNIIEIGCVLTDADLNEKGEFTSVVSPDATALGRLFQNETVREMHQTNGLLYDVIEAGDTRKVHAVTMELHEWLLSLNAPLGQIALAGSGVGHFDRPFIAKYMPQLAGWLRYWVIDVGVIRRASEMWAGVLPTFPQTESGAHAGKTHRALDDARCHLEEGRYWRGLWQTLTSV